MICPRCKVDMEIGIAIAPFERRGIIYCFPVISDYKTMKLVDVYKCPQCGHSDDGNDPTKLRGVSSSWTKPEDLDLKVRYI